MTKKFAVLGGINDRSKIYLKSFKEQKLKPEIVVLYGEKIDKKSINSMNKLFDGIKYINLKHASNLKIKKLFRNIDLDFIIFSGYPGEILKTKLFKDLKINILHTHTGKLPYFKGSTTIYYTILAMNKIYCSTFIMTDIIDSGDILHVKEYPLPKNPRDIENQYDNEIRAKNFIDIIKKKKLSKSREITKNISKIEDYYFIAHPILRKITIERIKKNKYL